MVPTHPMRVPGKWKQGYVLDYHTVSSTYIGDNEFGHPVFETTRTELGELLYRLKYKYDDSLVDELVETAAAFVVSWRPGVQVVVPVPPSRRARSKQPVFEVSERLAARLGIEFAGRCVVKSKDTPELKDVYDYEERLSLLEGAFEIKAEVQGRVVLLFDDLYRSGATMNAVTEVLQGSGHVREVYALALTRTRRT